MCNSNSQYWQLAIWDSGALFTCHNFFKKLTCNHFNANICGQTPSGQGRERFSDIANSDKISEDINRNGNSHLISDVQITYTMLRTIMSLAATNARNTSFLLSELLHLSHHFPEHVARKTGPLAINEASCSRVNKF
jgi:hypothetical protein